MVLGFNRYLRIGDLSIEYRVENVSRVAIEHEHGLFNTQSVNKPPSDKQQIDSYSLQSASHVRAGVAGHGRKRRATTTIVLIKGEQRTFVGFIHLKLEFYLNKINSINW